MKLSVANGLADWEDPVSIELTLIFHRIAVASECFHLLFTLSLLVYHHAVFPQKLVQEEHHVLCKLELFALSDLLEAVARAVRREASADRGVAKLGLQLVEEALDATDAQAQQRYLATRTFESQ